MESQLHSAHHTTTKQIVLLREQLEHANHCGRKLWKAISVHTQHCGCTPLDNHLPSLYELLYGRKPKTLMPSSKKDLQSRHPDNENHQERRIMKGNKDKLKSMIGKQ